MVGEQEQQDLATCGSKSFAQRYVVILDEFRKEALGALPRKDSTKESKRPAADQRGKAHTGGHGLTDVPPLAEESVTQLYRQESDRRSFSPLTHGWTVFLSPDSYIAELTGWGDCDCLASTRLGEFGS